MYLFCVSVIETVQSTQESIPVLVDGIRNGKVNMKESRITNIRDNFNLSKTIYEPPDSKEETELDINFPTSSWTQFCILLSRMMLQLKRNKLLIAIQLFNVLLGSSLTGLLFYKLGNNGTFGFDNFKYCICLLTYFMYTYLMTAALLCKLHFT